MVLFKKEKHSKLYENAVAIRDELLKEIEKSKREQSRPWLGPHILIGNGFSQALIGNPFSYENLFSALEQRRSSFTDWDTVTKFFNKLGTRDFEAVIRLLDDALEVTSLYCCNDPRLGWIQSDSDALRRELIECILQHHPNKPLSVIRRNGKDVHLSEKHYLSCAKFLSEYSRIFTINYDLLLYWVVCIAVSKDPTLKFNDGFFKDDQGQLKFGGSGRQNIFFLHGGLHIFGNGADVTKLDYDLDNELKIIEQLKFSSDQEKPFTVAEGEGKRKKQKLIKNAATKKAYERLKYLKGTLFTYGVSFNQDSHVIEAVAKSEVQLICYGTYHPDDEVCCAKFFKEVTEQRDKLIEMSKGKNEKERPKLSVVTFDVRELDPWGLL